MRTSRKPIPRRFFRYDRRFSDFFVCPTLARWLFLRSITRNDFADAAHIGHRSLCAVFFSFCAVATRTNPRPRVAHCLRLRHSPSKATEGSNRSSRRTCGAPQDDNSMNKRQTSLLGMTYGTDNRHFITVYSGFFSTFVRTFSTSECRSRLRIAPSVENENEIRH